MTAFLVLMLLILCIPLYAAWRGDHIWSKMLAFASIATKAAVMILLVSVDRDDWMIGIVGVIVLSVGNGALMLLAQILRRLRDVANL